MTPRPPRPTLFPYTTLFRSEAIGQLRHPVAERHRHWSAPPTTAGPPARPLDRSLQHRAVLALQDRKSTRLNSSHGYISYAVFCLKKKKRNKPHSHYPPHSHF